VARYTLNGAGQIDMASEKVILAIPAVEARLHTGGALAFDAQGNLFITVGDNAAGEEGPGNTNDLRGKILRIKPKEDGSGYTIPAGNLFPEGTAKTKPEIYIMGTRNAYSVALDPLRPGWVGWGDVGPDGKGNAEEHNAAAKAGNYGYPFYAGDQIQLIAGGTPQAPVNNNPKNTGLNALPPAIKATNAYPQAAAVTGPLFRFNAKSTAPYKFPPHFEGMWFVTDFSKNTMDTILLNQAGDTKVAVSQVFKNLRLDRPLDFQQGPDGALYAINYSGWFSATATTALVRLEYSGSCKVVGVNSTEAPDKTSLAFRGMTLAINEPGAYTLDIVDMQGRNVATYRAEGRKSFDLANLAKGGASLYTARITTAAGSYSRKLMLSK
jgi:cytochrome c